eukprot:TRINITY_DN60773_c0_g1_i1.p1 TRINITY_DN60773_c0_g1~~TRINITY_DN60773_c0_g1_i1.p1  ORF type:complete len:376 (+),score=37.82 TRINITY_DN60773_c0_g1_i1:136-1263(+)
MMAAQEYPDKEWQWFSKSQSVLRHRALEVLLPCGAFMMVGPALVMTNKMILRDLKFEFPLALSSLGLITSSLIIRACVWFGFIGGLRPESAALVSGWGWYRTALPIGLAKAVTLAAGNMVYLHLGVGFIQMLKAFTPAIVIAVMPLAGASRPPKLAVASVFLIVLGTLTEVKENFSATHFGISLMLISETCEAFHLVFTQVLLQNKKLTVVEGLFTLAPVSAACLIFCSLCLESRRMFETQSWRIVAEHPKSFLFVSFLGFVVNFVGLAVVRVTSSLTAKVLNLARCVGLVFIGVFVYGESISVQQRIGYSIAVVGFIGYNTAMKHPDNSDRIVGSRTSHENPCSTSVSSTETDITKVGASDQPEYLRTTDIIKR